MTDPYAAYRQLERVLGDLEIREPSSSSFEELFGPRVNDRPCSEKGEVVATVVYNLEKETVEYIYPDGRHITKRA